MTYLNAEAIGGDVYGSVEQRILHLREPLYYALCASRLFPAFCQLTFQTIRWTLISRYKICYLRNKERFQAYISLFWLAQVVLTGIFDTEMQHVREAMHKWIREDYIRTIFYEKISKRISTCQNLIKISFCQIHFHWFWRSVSWCHKIGETFRDHSVWPQFYCETLIFQNLLFIFSWNPITTPISLPLYIWHCMYMPAYHNCTLIVLQNSWKPKPIVKSRMLLFGAIRS